MVRKIYYIDEITEKFPFTEEEIKLFHEEGLIEIFTDNDSIFFYDDALERLEIIKRLKYELGVNLEGIDVILHMREKMINMQENFIDFIEEIKKEIFELKKPLKIRDKTDITIT
jgi:MerR family transcriptional regulator/heat shock protein HspR